MQQAPDHRTAPRQQQQQQQPVSGTSSASSSPYGWSLTSAHSPLAASAPRSVWVPASPGRAGTHGHGLSGYGYGSSSGGGGGRTNSSQLRLVDFRLPAWAGVRTSCGCLSHTEVAWGKEGAGGVVAPGLDAGSGLGGGLSGGAVRSLRAGGLASGAYGGGGVSPAGHGVSTPACGVGMLGLKWGPGGDGGRRLMDIFLLKTGRCAVGRVCLFRIHRDLCLV